MANSQALASSMSWAKNTANRGVTYLVMAQIAVLCISTVAFAVLARTLGPSSFGTFAGVVFVFTVSSLLTDLSPQAFLLVRGVSSSNYAGAQRMALISLGSSIVLMTALIAIYGSLDRDADYDLMTYILLVVGLVSQFAMQAPRALLVVGHKYAALTGSDVLGTLMASIAAVTMAHFGAMGLHVLTLQLGLTMALRYILVRSGVFVFKLRPVPVDAGGAVSLGEGIRFGLTVIPLNIGSYMSRSLDSGLMPLLLPSSTAGVYARSYQLVIVPVTQAQLAIGPWVLNRLGAAARRSSNPREPLFTKAWLALTSVSTAGALFISVFSIPIAAIIFGPGWPNAPLMLACMAATLPSLACNTYFAWATQIFPRRRASFAHLAVVLLAPISALSGAVIGGVNWALIGLVFVGGLMQPLGLLLVHKKVLPVAPSKFVLVVSLQWSVPAILFCIELTRR